VRIEELQPLIKKAIPAVKDLAVIESSVLTVHRLVDQLAALRESVAHHDKRISEIAVAHPDYAVFSSLPGAGPVMVPRLIAAFGTQRNRYASASALQCYAGIAPVTESSGKQRRVHWRWACPKFLRQTFPRMGLDIDPEIRVGSRLLRHPARARKRPSRRGASTVLQVAADSLPLLAESHPLRRNPLFSGPCKARSFFGCGNPREKCCRFFKGSRLFLLTSLLRCLCGTRI
jgi:hypothetical protein